MAEAMDKVLAVSDRRAAELARITLGRLRYWERTGLVVPSIRRQVSPGKTVRLYSFEDLLELLVAAELRHREISLQHIRRIVEHLRHRDFTSPLREVRFATHGKNIYIQYPDGNWSGDPVPDQVIFSQAVDLNLVGARIGALAAKRDPQDAGRVVKRPGVLGGKPIFAGTRIPVGTVQRYLQAGYSSGAIIEEYPSLTPEDIEAARQHSKAS